MVFSSTLFLFLFFPVVLAGYYLIRGKYRNYWLLLVSLIFFSWSQPQYLWIILTSIIVNYVAAMLIENSTRFCKAILVVGIALNLLLLIYFKYFDFLLDSINKICGQSFELKNIILPVGISFFTFQGMSYVIDVYRHEVKTQRNLFKVALYITLFPQLIAGPIVRYKDIAIEIDNRETDFDAFCEGITRFIVGLAKKSLIANTMAAMVDSIWANGAEGNTAIVAWAGSIAYTLQIYFDFSGYSDMAIGLGRMFGFHFNENFNLPYISKTVSEFWRRWHMSLSTWFRDYVYIPLGGNRKRVYLNLAIVFLLTGIWHGASWHFLVWGGWNGAFILIERAIRSYRKTKDDTDYRENRTLSSPNIVSKFYTLMVVNLGWVLFRAPSTGDAISYIKSMFGIILPEHPGFTLLWYLDGWTLTMLVCGILFSSPLPMRLWINAKSLMNTNMTMVIKYIGLLTLFGLSVMRIVSGTYNPFIYFQF